MLGRSNLITETIRDTLVLQVGGGHRNDDPTFYKNNCHKTSKTEGRSSPTQGCCTNGRRRHMEKISHTERDSYQHKLQFLVT